MFIIHGENSFMSSYTDATISLQNIFQKFLETSDIKFMKLEKYVPSYFCNKIQRNIIS